MIRAGTYTNIENHRELESQKFSSSFFCHSRAVMRINNNVMNYTFDGSRVFFTSDTHFNHTNIIRFCDRPFGSTEEMNEKLIGNWNSVVGPDDIVFHLGDFCLGGSAEWTKVLDRLNGKIYLIISLLRRRLQRCMAVVWPCSYQKEQYRNRCRPSAVPIPDTVRCRR